MQKEIIGLSTHEARQLLQKLGFNEINDPGRSSSLEILLRQIKKNYIVYLLVIAAIISFLVGKDITGYTILFVVFLVVGVGFLQEFRAEKAISSLKMMLMPVSIVLRDGKETEIPSKELVPGDIVILGNGEKIPADCVILEAHDLEVNESVLTGESKDITKLAYQRTGEYKSEQVLYMGTFIVSGRCVAKVLATGMNTEFGKIANLISTTEKTLPLQDKVNKISFYMVLVAVTVSAATGLLMFARLEVVSPEVLTNILILIIALTVSAFPEGFPVVLITTLATGAARMAKQNAIVNRMSIIETLGETTVICTDKTGTVTRGEMTVKYIVLAGGDDYQVSGTGYEGKGEFIENRKSIDPTSVPSLQILLQAAVLCNDSRIERTGEDLQYKVMGSATEGSLMVLASKAEIFKENIQSKRLSEQPFSSERKMMSVVCELSDGLYVFAKGAPEILLNHCTHSLVNGKLAKMVDTTSVDKDNERLNHEAYRTLAFAYKKIESINEYNEEDLVYIGLVGMEDPPREQVAESIQLCYQAGIKVKMITGDHKNTAVAIGRQIGLVGNVLEGQDIEGFTDEQLSAELDATVIFARVKPEHKLRIVRLLKAKGEIVTMTGDGVNDSPALKEAHVGVAMGISGTDVSRSIADLTLKDDNFVTIVAAIKEGRTIFNNIRKFVTYQLSCNLAELSILFIGVLVSPWLGWEAPLLTALQILFMNLVTDNLPAITLGFNKSSQDIMSERPRRNENILNRKFIQLIIFNGFLMASLTLAVYWISFNVLQQTTEVARTHALVTLILLEIASAFNFRSYRFPTLNRSIMTNPYLVYASLISLIATLIIIYTPMSRVFETVPLSFYNWGISIVVSFVIILVFDLLKTDLKGKDGLLARLN